MDWPRLLHCVVEGLFHSMGFMAGVLAIVFALKVAGVFK
jgi:hypothetical protein